MPGPDMRAYVRRLRGETLSTVALGRPNTVVSVTDDRALVETRTGKRNYASLTELQGLADRIFDGEEVALPARGRSAFHAAVLATLPEVDHATSPRRFWLRDSPASFGAEYGELFPDEDPVTASEGRISYIRHRVRERSPLLRRAKIQNVLDSEGQLACEVCGFDFAAQYGVLGDGFIECHHTRALSEGDERETAVDDLALICANCHRMIHRSRPMIAVPELRELVMSMG